MTSIAFPLSTDVEWRGERLPVKTEAKKLSSTSAFSSSVDARSPFSFISGEALLVILCIPCHVQLQLRPGLPDPVPTQAGSIPILFPVYLSLLPLPVQFLLALQFDQQGPDYTPCLSHIPQDCELHQCVTTAAQASSNLDVTDELTCIGDHQVQCHIPSGSTRVPETATFGAQALSKQAKPGLAGVACHQNWQEKPLPGRILFELDEETSQLDSVL
ncbi:hypothetical protein QYF61_017913, partial [Mycteria americana]